MDGTTKNNARKRSAADNPPSLKITPANDADLEHLPEQPHHLAHLTPQLVALLTHASPMALQAIEAAAVAIVGAAPVTTPAALPPAGVACMNLLASRPPYRGTSLAEMEAEIFARTGKTWSEKSIRRNLLPLLREWGVQSSPRIGYHLPTHCRLFHIQHHKPTSYEITAA